MEERRHHRNRVKRLHRRQHRRQLPDADIFEWVDATTPPRPGSEGWWFSNGTVATTTGCTLSDACSLAEVQAAAPEAEISYSLGLGKGRDTLDEILIKELKLNGTAYTFGPLGTYKE